MIRGRGESPAVAEAIGALREHRERVTPARRAVLEVLDAARDHLTAEDVAERVDASEPGVHRATVYRSLQSLAELGIVAHTHVPGGATIYHLRHSPAAVTSHAHLQCTTCMRFFDAPVEWLAPLRDRLGEELEFRLDVQHAALLGTCAQCREIESQG
ncbi:Fur family transcriptional regulator [Flexivirga meconopsidis]|uniref:Fur family transcriptional regulator n=1 Tax=Flexivirga meconopsidis TaxID=2977121 RepID=UPI00224039B2